MKMLVPWRLIAWMISKTWSTKCGDSPIEGLVHAQQPRPCHQRARHRHHLLLASRQRAGDLAEALAMRGNSSNTRSRSAAISPLSLR